MGRTLWLSLAIALLVGCTPPSMENATVTRAVDPSGFLGAALTEPYTMPNQTLTDTSGRAYNLTTSPSKPVTLMFFGYTKCPDVCSGVLADVAQAMSRLDEVDRAKIQLIFVTTDPKRDTGPVMVNYLKHFDPSFLGLTADLATIKEVAGPMGVLIEGTKRLPSGGYEVSHSAQVIGFDQHHQGIVVWTPGTPIADLRHDFALLVAKQR